MNGIPVCCTNTREYFMTAELKIMTGDASCQCPPLNRLNGMLGDRRIKSTSSLDPGEFRGARRNPKTYQLVSRHIIVNYKNTDDMKL